MQQMRDGVMALDGVAAGQIDAERNLFSAEVAHTQTQSQVYVSLVNLYKAMGGGWVLHAEQMSAPGLAGRTQP